MATIDSFTVTPQVVVEGSPVTVAWQTTGADIVTLNDVQVAPDGSLTEIPASDKTYTLVATDTPVQATVSVVVTQPPPPVMPTFTNYPFNVQRMVLLEAQFMSAERYERYNRLTVLSGTTARLYFRCTTLNLGTRQPFLANTYTLRINGVVKATSNGNIGQLQGFFDLPLADVPVGYAEYRIDVPTSESNVPWWYIFNKQGDVTQDFIPVCTDTHNWANAGHPYTVAIVHSTFSEKAVPLVARECPEFNTAINYSQLYRTNTVPCRASAIYRKTLNKDGIISTANQQSYFWAAIIDKYPTVPLIDGPRGVGTFQMPTHIHVDRHGGVIAADPWRIVRVNQEGVIRTRCGYRDPHPASYWQDAGVPELVGDWSAVTNKGFHETWGLAHDSRSLALDPAAPPIGGEQPHLIGPVQFVPDSQNNRVCRLQYRKDDFDAEPVVTEFLTGLQDPWDCVEIAPGRLAVSERKFNRIVEYDMDSGALIRVIVQGQAGLATVPSSRIPQRIATLATIRAQPCILPEGLFFQDGWLYFGSYAMQQVRKVNLTTGENLVACTPTNVSRYVKIALSDGTFGPRGTVFLWTWALDGHGGFPQVFIPSGAEWFIFLQKPYPNGKGGQWDGMGYAHAGGIGKGRLYCGSSIEGLVMISKALPTDVAPTSADYAKYLTGAQQYNARGFKLVHGDGGYGYHGLPLPWGINSDIDFYLTTNGHVRP